MKRSAITAKEMQQLDRMAIEKYGVPSLCLMENAGRAVAQAAASKTQTKRTKGIKRVVIVCGLGNNGGDGFVAARHLVNNGIEAVVYVAGDPEKIKGDALVNYQILKKCRYPVKEIKKVDKNFIEELKRAGIVIDALFGTGLSRDISGLFAEVIEAVNTFAGEVIAVDIPSGLNATTGEILGCAVEANKTVTFVLPKKGFYENDGPDYAGEVVVADIGIPRIILNK
ncbi:MAG: NAD(P)H-hydrate epimerase [Candidatus Omnitrophica bacterium]|nr:NAD(P)H-hydrate epimerase [Candidatus Omnitrophota bacterium]